MMHTSQAPAHTRPSESDALCDPRAVELAQNLDLLLDIVDLILGVLEIDNLDGNKASCPLIDSGECARARGR